MKKIGLYETSVLLFFALLPVIAVVIDLLTFSTHDGIIRICLKWFVFSGVGLRLLTSGVKQALQPDFTANEIFNIHDDKCYPIIKELGYANICIGLIGILSLFLPTFRYAAGLAGGLYFGLAGLLHVLRTKTEKKEVFAMISDFYMSVILFILIILTLALA